MPDTTTNLLTCNDALRILRAHEGEMRARDVVGAALFGSAARGEAGPESDIDIVIDLVPGRKFSLIDLGGLRVRLCDWFGREADVLNRQPSGDS